MEPNTRQKQARPLAELHEWDKNPRKLKTNDYHRLREQVEALGQYKPLLVMPDGTILGGNMRYKAYCELGIQDVWVSTVDFIQKEDGLWYAIVNGQEQAKRFYTKQDGMMEYSLSDNDRAGFYDADLLANIQSEYTINWDAYSVDMGEPITVNQVAPVVEPDKQPKDDKPLEVTCPSCGHTFIA